MMKIKKYMLKKIKAFIEIIFPFLFAFFMIIGCIRDGLKEWFGIKNPEVENPENINQLIEVLGRQYDRKYEPEFNLYEIIINDISKYIEADGDIKDNSNSWQLIDFCIFRYMDDVVEWLVKQGADINAQNDEGNTPLIEIFKSDIYDIFEDYDGDKEEIIKNRADIDFPQVKNLIRLGADKSIANHKGETIESIALKHGKEIYSLYQEHFL